MKKILNIIIVLFIGILLSCHPGKQVINDGEIQYGSSIMYNAFEGTYSRLQFDSICKADRISNNLNKWHVLYVIDSEDGNQIGEFMYIKYYNNVEYIYRVIKRSENKYKITKRIRK